jgi:transposase
MSKPPAFKPADKHMAARKAQGLTHREVAGEFGTSKSTAHRKVQKIKTDRGEFGLK